MKQLLFQRILIAASFIVALLLILSGMTSMLEYYFNNSSGLPDNFDKSIWLDAAWRLASDQIPYRDFLSPIGHAWLYWFHFTTLPFNEATADHLPLMNLFSAAVLALLLTLGLVTVFRGENLLGRFFVLLTLVAALLSLSFQAPYPDYNYLGLPLLAYGWILALILNEASLASESINTHLLCLLIGATGSILLFWKLNFFALFAPAVVLAMLRCQSLRLVFVIAFGFLVTSLALLALIRFDVSALLANLALPVGTPRAQSLLPSLTLGANYKDMFVQFFLAFLIIFFFMSGGLLKRIVASSVILFLATAVFRTNAAPLQPYPLLLGIALLSVQFITQKRLKHAIGILFLFSLLARYWSIEPASVYSRWKAVTTFSQAPQSMNDYSLRIQAGLDLLDHLDPERTQTVCVLGYSNPFNFLRKSIPPLHDRLWWNYMDSYISSQLNLGYLASLDQSCSIWMQEKTPLSEPYSSVARDKGAVVSNFISQKVRHENRLWIAFGPEKRQMELGIRGQ